MKSVKNKILEAYLKKLTVNFSDNEKDLVIALIENKARWLNELLQDEEKLKFINWENDISLIKYLIQEIENIENNFGDTI
jgi:hypothetical protein